MKQWGKQLAVLIFCSAACAGCGDGEDAGPRAVDPIDEYSLAEAVDVLVDDQGVPHIYAQSDLDLFFASGYEQARWALYDLELTRRASNGTLAEVLGPDFLQSDQQSRTMGFARWGSESIALMREEKPADHNLIVAYVAGINRRIAEVRGGSEPLPDGFAEHDFEPEPWHPEDVLGIGVRIQFGFSSTLAFDVLGTLAQKLIAHSESVPIYAPYGSAYFMKSDVNAAKMLPPFPASPIDASNALEPAGAKALFGALAALYRNHGMGEGSNNWVVRGDFTENGRPFLVNDSHASLTDPNRMMVQHLSSVDAGGHFDAVGFSFLGVPGVHVGHNRRIAWGATTAFSDVMDIWQVELSDAEVTLGADKLAVETHTETIRVRQTDGTTSELAFEVRQVPTVGVLLPSEILPVPKVLLGPGELLLGWPGFAPTTEIETFFGFDLANDLSDFEAAVDHQLTGMQNWVAASAQGIRFRSHGLVPDRGPVQGRPRANLLLDGSDPTTVWTGAMLDRDRLPALDGTQPFIVTANNDPWGHSADNDPTNDDFYYGSYFSPGIRAQRLTDRLTALTAVGGISRADMEALETDTASTLAVELVPLLTQAVLAIATDASLAQFGGRPELGQAATELSSWDGRATLDSRPAALFRLFTAFLSRRTLEPSFDALFDGIDEAQAVTIQKISMLVHIRGIEALLGGKQRYLLVAALSDALAAIAEKDAALGGPTTWGDLHVGVFRTTDGKRTLVPIPGDDSTVNVAQCHCWDDKTIAEHCESTAGAVYRFVVGFDEDGTPVATFDTPMNNAGSTQDWIGGVYRPLRFRKGDVEDHAESQRSLSSASSH